ncbi:MAG: aminotransferase class I/II-fold pyridoxal phosphate-dependent enzyme [Clostridia bacterium]|nr:aminotransferase class I/II-fold pyridoxal phosphate-dependent enzyme [Clostridia bacterium]
MQKGLQAYLRDKATLKNCKIYQMLSKAAKGRHVSFHTPGHKNGRWDITELSFSDNLSAPKGCIAEAEKDIAEILGAQKSFILTDGSTSGVLAMLYVAAQRGVKRIAVCKDSHKSVFNGCKLWGITPLIYTQPRRNKIPFPHTMSATNEEFMQVLTAADAVFLTSPDYYGNVADLAPIQAFCQKNNKLLLIDGAHGGHLHFDKAQYAGAYADIWVDGVHKSLPAFTQGAVVSARTAELGEALRKAVDIFRTTSPSYPVMASVEYAVKYPKNEALEREVAAFKNAHNRIYPSADWTKLCVRFGKDAFTVEKELEKAGLYAEFCDGNVVMFYLSAATTKKQFALLKNTLVALFEKYPLKEDTNENTNETTGGEKSSERIVENTAENTVQLDHAPLVLDENTRTQWVSLDEAIGCICACACGMFPPCTPLISVGEQVKQEQIELLKNADNVFGLCENKILVYKHE